MSSLASRTISALRADHDLLAGLVPGLTDEQLGARSGASEWTVADVLSHLGSGAEIALGWLRAALGTADAPGEGFNQSVWDRWNALAPREQAEGSLAHDELLVSTLEGLTEQQLETTELVGFFPFPLPLAAFGGVRLNEVALHSWDARVAVDPDAEVTDDAAEVLLEHLAIDIGFMLGFVGKAERLSAPAAIAFAGTPFTLVVDDGLTVTTENHEPTATFSGAPGAALRLVGGRLTEAHTPSDVTVEGNVSLDDLRAVFPGF